MVHHRKKRAESPLEILTVHKAQVSLSAAVVGVAAGGDPTPSGNSLRQLHSCLVGLAAGIHIVNALEIIGKDRAQKGGMLHLGTFDHFPIDHQVGIILHLRLDGIYDLSSCMPHVGNGNTGYEIKISVGLRIKENTLCLHYT